jgi:hypothetical protein
MMAWSRQTLDQLDHALRLVRAHAGQRLVEQQHARLGGQAHGDLELALLAVGAWPRRARAMGEAGGFQRGLGALVDVGKIGGAG